jgi:hypothetical protein
MIDSCQVQVLRKRQARLLPEEEDAYIRFLTWTFENAISGAAMQGRDRWCAIMDMHGCAPWPSLAFAHPLRPLNLC